MKKLSYKALGRTIALSVAGPMFLISAIDLFATFNNSHVTTGYIISDLCVNIVCLLLAIHYVRLEFFKK
jgi:hypothetical protein